MNRPFRTMIFLIFLFLLNSSFSQTAEIKNAAELQLAIEKLNVLGSVLYIGAHPDDENTGLMAYLSKARKFRTAYLSLTRGDGGQNLIGSEKGVEIGIIRTQELLEARRIDGAEQFFTRAIDFGYSKSADESLNIWGRDSVFSDVVWVIRKFRPDVIITRFPPDGNGGHGHHTASAILSKEAFKAAADPNVFPEQLKYVQPWQAKRIFWNSWRPGNDEIKGLIGADIGEYNPLLGKSYTEISAESRSMHKSQGFGSSPNRGSRMEYFKFVDGEPVHNDIFEGINTKWDRIENSSKIIETIFSLNNSFDPSHPSGSLDLMVSLHSDLNKRSGDYWIEIKKKELLEIIKYAAGLWIQSVSSDFSAAPGEQLNIKTTLIARGSENFKITKMEFPTLSSNSDINSALLINQPFTKESVLNLPEDYPVSQPYWLEKDPSDGLFNITDQSLISLAENPPAVPVNILIDYKGEVLTFTAPLLYKWNSDIEGEQHRPFYVYPRVTLNMDNKVAVFNGSSDKTVQIKLKSFSPNTSGQIHLHSGEGWNITPGVIPFSFRDKNDELLFDITITPPQQPGQAVLKAEINIDNKTFSKSDIEISYPHIQPQVYFPEAETKLVKLDLKKTASRIGYIMGSGDEVFSSLQDLGYDITLLSDNFLETGDLSRFDVIIAGIRAYNVRERLKYSQPKLMQFVQNGGTFIAQYNVSSELLTDKIGPYPITPGRGRITVEDSPVNFVNPDHQLLNFPNKITNNDFEGWIQERGLYFAENWDPKYETVISAKDPGEEELRGGMLFTRYGKGIFICSGYSWFRQLPAGVPGAYRIFVNMISAGKYEKSLSN